MNNTMEVSLKTDSVKLFASDFLPMHESEIYSGSVDKELSTKIETHKHVRTKNATSLHQK